MVSLHNIIDSIKKTTHSIWTVSLLFSITVGVFIPASLFLGNVDEFHISFLKITPIIFLCGIFLFVCSILISCCFLRLSDYWTAFFWGVVVAFYIQGNFMNGGLPKLDGREVDWSNFKFETILSVVLWLFFLFVPIIFIHFKPVLVKKIIRFSSLFLCFVQMISLVTLIVTTKPTHNNDYVLTDKDEFLLSKNKNTIVFIIDTMDARWIETYLAKFPETKEKLSGFVGFDNVVGGGAPTILGIPAMLTGQLYNPTEPREKYFVDSYRASPLFKDLKNNGCSVNIYSDYTLLDGVDPQSVDNLEMTVEYSISSFSKFVKYLYKLVGLYIVPQNLKKYFWFYSDSLTNLVETKDTEFNKYDDNDDPKFYRNFKDSGIKLNSDKARFVFYHLSGCHGPYSMNENAESVNTEETSLFQQMQGIFKIIFEYFEELKKLGIYDNSTIIIAADHGGVEYYQNPALLVKRANENSPFEWNSAPVTFRNLWSFFATSTIGKDKKYGKDLFDVSEDENVVRYHVADRILVKPFYPLNEAVRQFSYIKLEVDSDARDMGNIRILTKPVFSYLKYSMSKLLYFSSDSPISWKDYAFGLYGSEDWGTWTEGNETNLYFKIKNTKEDLSLVFYYDTYHDQYCILYANGIKVDEWECNGRELRKVRIPAGCIKNDGKLELTFEVPTAQSPKDNGESEDSRMLGLRFRSMAFFSEKEKDSKIIDTFNEDVDHIVSNILLESVTNTYLKYYLSQRFSFASGKLLQWGSFFSGLWYKEPYGTWSDGNKTVLCFKIKNKKENEDLILELDYTTYHNQCIILYANNVKIDEWEFNGSELRKIKIPSECIKHDGNLELIFELPNAQSPKENGESEDIRKLALCFKTLIIKESESEVLE